MLPMRLFTWLFPQTTPIEVSRILRVSGWSGHEPNSKSLQNKQGTGGGVPASSPMLKLVKEIESVKNVSLAGVYFHIPFCSHLPPLFMKKDDDPLFMESGRLVSEMEGRQALHLRVNHFSSWITKLS